MRRENLYFLRWNQSHHRRVKQLILIGGKAKEVKKLRDLWNKKISEIEDSKDELNSASMVFQNPKEFLESFTIQKISQFR